MAPSPEDAAAMSGEATSTEAASPACGENACGEIQEAADQADNGQQTLAAPPAAAAGAAAAAPASAEKAEECTAGSEPMESSKESSKESRDLQGAGETKSPVVMALLHLKWASFLQKAGQHEKAAEHYLASVKLQPSARGHFGRGTCLASLRRRPEAVEALQEALKINPNLASVHINLAGVLLALGHMSEAERHCRFALELEPSSREAVMNLGNILRNLGRREEAMEIVWQHVAKWGDGNRMTFEAPPRTQVVKKQETDAGAAAEDSPEQAGGNAEERNADDSAVTADAKQTEESAAVAEVPAKLRCSEWRSSAAGEPGLIIACVKWGKRYDATYVNRLYAGVRRHMRDSELKFVCFTDNMEGLLDDIEGRPLPSGLELWWGKAYLFSEEAGLDGHRVLFLDLDQVVVGSLSDVAAYAGPFAVLSTDDIACELASGGYNSSVMSWEASPYFRPLYTRLTKAALRYVHRFDHWLEMNVAGADLWQQIAPGRVIDYTSVFRGGVCLGSTAEEEARTIDTSFAAEPSTVEGSASADVQDSPTPPAATRTSVMPKHAAIVTFPRFPKPHEVIDRHEWVRLHWVGDAELATSEPTPSE